ncbi:MAG: ATP-grasp domain-containing protein, partial [Candidatus Eisenbacteria bacterium]|nr:ATP-grasp domain-containing protein [Candidatus Eisenbacteria bacterium]
GVIWIGPPPRAIGAMGDKIAARRTVEASGVPLIPGSGELPADPEAACGQAAAIGYPVLIKAAFGGGGKGMRLCANDEELRAAVEMARQEAGRAFGNATIYLERAISHPRHVEIQILADQHGQVIHLGERECSIQRRHQKLLEETPTPAPFAGLRDRMGRAAVAIACEIGYTNAGTVEFLVDPEGGFYFLEVNTRLQVEHPITEAVTGIDIVRRQLRIALGERLDIRQEQVEWRGHAIECRINAEDPARGFLPSTGWIRSVRLPAGAGARNDVGFQTGTEVTPHYDPLIGKLIIWGEDREQAIDRALRAIREYRIVGIQTNLPFHSWLLGHPRFRAGATDTAFLEEEFRPEEILGREEETAAILAAALAEYRGDLLIRRESARPSSAESAWKRAGRPGPGWGNR